MNGEQLSIPTQMRYSVSHLYMGNVDAERTAMWNMKWKTAMR
jgi:hypothetical protein